MKRNRILAFLLAGAMCLGLTACGGNNAASTASTSAAEAGIYTAGTYTASADGRNGPVTMEVTFSSDAIESVTVTEHTETEGVADPAIERIPQAIVDAQSLPSPEPPSLLRPSWPLWRTASSRPAAMWRP